MEGLRAGILLFVTWAVLALSACGDSGSGNKTGRISIGVSDHPMHDVSKVCIAFNEIELKRKQGSSILADKLMDAAETINVNLIEFQGMNAAPLLMDYEVPAGEYLWMRLGVNALRDGMGGMDDATPEAPDCQGTESYLVSEGTVHNLFIPSGAETGLKLLGPIIVPHGGEANFTAEVDLMKSVAFPGGLSGAEFRPTLKLVNNAEVGAVTGQVANNLIDDNPGCAPTVYIFEDDMMEAGLDVNNSLTSAIVQAQTNELQETGYHYTIGFLLEGNYELAFSCDDGATLQPSTGKSVFIEANSEPAIISFP
jgi:hypothetical protein